MKHAEISDSPGDHCRISSGQNDHLKKKIPQQGKELGKASFNNTVSLSLIQPKNWQPAASSFRTVVSDCNRFEVSQRDLTLKCRKLEFGADVMDEFQASRPELFERQPSWERALMAMEQACIGHRELVQARKASQFKSLGFTEVCEKLKITNNCLGHVIRDYPIAVSRKRGAVSQKIIMLFDPEAFDSVVWVLKMQAEGRSQSYIRRKLEEGDWAE